MWLKETYTAAIMEVSIGLFTMLKNIILVRQRDRSIRENCIRCIKRIL